MPPLNRDRLVERVAELLAESYPGAKESVHLNAAEDIVDFIAQEARVRR